MKVSNRLKVVSTLNDTVQLCAIFKRETLEATEKCSKSRCDFALKKMLENTGTTTGLSHTTRALLNKDKVMYVKNFSEGVKGHFNGNNLRLACRAQKVCLKPALRVKPI